MQQNIGFMVMNGGSPGDMQRESFIQGGINDIHTRERTKPKKFQNSHNHRQGQK